MCKIDKNRANFMKRKRERNAMRKKPDEDAQFLKMFGLSLTASCFYAEGVLYSLQNERLSGVGENE